MDLSACHFRIFGPFKKDPMTICRRLWYSGIGTCPRNFFADGYVNLCISGTPASVPMVIFFLTVSTLEWVSVHYMCFIRGIFLCTVPSGGGCSGRSSDTCALHSAVSSPVCQHTLDDAVHSYQQ